MVRRFQGRVAPSAMTNPRSYSLKRKQINLSLSIVKARIYRTTPLLARIRAVLALCD
ncbi:MAG: hypothetical protein DHS20C04_05280 [Hyphococcus sp.]|nr:MAG: hypothetical protein DHS20C04_05280 [Marinicaulis sp.]